MNIGRMLGNVVTLQDVYDLLSANGLQLSELIRHAEGAALKSQKVATDMRTRAEGDIREAKKRLKTAIEAAQAAHDAVVTDARADRLQAEGLAADAEKRLRLTAKFKKNSGPK